MPRTGGRKRGKKPAWTASSTSTAGSSTSGSIDSGDIVVYDGYGDDKRPRRAPRDGRLSAGSTTAATSATSATTATGASSAGGRSYDRRSAGGTSATSNRRSRGATSTSDDSRSYRPARKPRPYPDEYYPPDSLSNSSLFTEYYDNRDGGGGSSAGGGRGVYDQRGGGRSNGGASAGNLNDEYSSYGAEAAFTHPHRSRFRSSRPAPAGWSYTYTYSYDDGRPVPSVESSLTIESSSFENVMAEHTHAPGDAPSEEFTNLLRICRQDRTRFVDDSFPPADTWERLSDLNLSNPEARLEVFNDVNPADVVQGDLADAWFVSAIAALADHGQAIRALFLGKSSKYGIFAISFFKNGRWVEVIVDDYVPFSNGRPSYAHSTDPGEFYPALIEKAFAKLHGGYLALEGGLTHNAMADLTGGVSEYIDLEAADVMASARDGSFWKLIRQYLSAGYLVSAGAPFGKETSLQDQDLVDSHAYTVLDAVVLEGRFQLVQIRNPHGHGKWGGAWSSRDNDRWNRSRRKALAYKAGDDKVFWIEFDDFVHFYSSLFVCKIFPDTKWAHSTLVGEWRGDAAHDNSKHPHFSLEVDTKRVHVVVSVRKFELRGSDRLFPASMVIIARTKGARVDYRRCKLVAPSTLSFNNDVEHHVETILKPSPEPYTIIVPTETGRETHRFALRVFSKTGYPIRVRKIAH